MRCFWGFDLIKLSLRLVGFRGHMKGDRWLGERRKSSQAKAVSLVYSQVFRSRSWYQYNSRRPDSPYAKVKICSELYGPLFREFRKCLWNVLRLICKPPLSGKVSEIANVPFKTKFGPISSVKLSIRQRRRPRKSSCSSKTSSKECIISCERRIKNWFGVS